ncbi:MAG: hypothetical protein RI947_1035 [Candidatus Parcubacteria bacterium]|jgi:RNA recognition motif-containing protein
MNKKLYVGNLLYEVTEDQLTQHFTQAGQVLTAEVIRFHNSGRSKGFGFVEMVDDAGAQKAIEMFNGQDFMGRKLVVSEARPPREKTEEGAQPKAAAPQAEEQPKA